MTQPVPFRRTLSLTSIIGAQQAGRLINQLAARVREMDLLPENIAVRTVCKRVSDSDPLLLAAPGQVWALNEQTSPLPAQRVAVLDRMPTSPPTVTLRPLDGPCTGQVEHYVLEVLNAYWLEIWTPADPELVEAGEQP